MAGDRPISIAAQIERMKARWPRFSVRDVDRRNHGARWIGVVEPQFSRYTIEVRHRLWEYPEVRVLSPALTRLPDNPEGQLPHVYPPADDPRLCLFDPRADEWNWSMPIADTIVPWACDWLACYEFWLVTGSWRGGGRHAGDAPIAPTEPT
jgi:hypothetical protein